MGITRVDIKVCRIDRPEICKTVKDAVVNTGATVSAIPAEVVKELGIELPLRRKFILATGQTVVRRVGFALIEYDGQKTADEIVSVRKGPPLLSAVVLERLGLVVDPRTRRLKKLRGSFLL